ncbi:MAG: hypothetical protein JWR90_140 [Marmoricola sp.]|jgi:hypothetical protein|nr:hypothetical protein [Marmoricola sp.]
MTDHYGYTAAKPPLRESSEQLRARVPGWGVDLDPQDRPSVPKLQLDPDATGAHWEFPERQPEHWPRERSIEHQFLTPVFGTAQPPRGLSGAIRKLAYARYSEGRAAHWLLLMAADRVDTVGSTLTSLASPHPDNLLAETGVLSEFKAHGLRSRLGERRTDVVHHPLDPIIVAGPWLLLGVVAYRTAKRVASRLRG